MLHAIYATRFVIQASAAMHMISVSFWDITQHMLVIPYRRFWNKLSVLELRPIGCPETSLKIYHHTRRNIPEDRCSYIEAIFLIFRTFALWILPKLKISVNQSNIESLTGLWCG